MFAAAPWIEPANVLRALEAMWDHGYTLVSRRWILATRVSPVTTIIATTIVLWHTATAHQIHELALGVALLLCGVALGTLAAAWWSR